MELKVSTVLDVGTVDPAKYPLPETRLTLEFLRDYVHLRPRTNRITAIAQNSQCTGLGNPHILPERRISIRHTPIITTSDCECAGEMFQVTTLINDAEKLEKEVTNNPPPSQQDVNIANDIVKEKGETVCQVKIR